jgi:hypothetical protein
VAPQPPARVAAAAAPHASKIALASRRVVVIDLESDSEKDEVLQSPCLPAPGPASISEPRTAAPEVAAAGWVAFVESVSVYYYYYYFYCYCYYYYYYFY